MENNYHAGEKISCGTFLKQIRHEKGLSLQKVSEETKILSSIIKNLENDEYESLPPPAYLKGILEKYAQYLKLDKEKVLELYRKSNGRNLSSGKDDKFPENKFLEFQLKPGLDFKNILVKFLKGFFIGLILAYFIYEASFFILPAKIILYSPASDFTTHQSELIISGKTIRTKILFINNQEIFLGKRGEFNEKIVLTPGLNKIEFKATDILGRPTTLIRQIIYRPLD